MRDLCGKSYRFSPSSSASFFFAGSICLLSSILPLHLSLIFLLSSALHECGHAAVMRLLRIPICGFRAAGGGAVLHMDLQAVSYRGEFAVAAAGPAVNLLLAMLFFRQTWDYSRESCLLNLMLAVYNLLPLADNDGAVMLLAAAEQLGRGDQMRRGLAVLSEILFALLWMMGAWILWYGALSDAGGTSVGYGVLFFCIVLRCVKKRGLP